MELVPTLLIILIAALVGGAIAFRLGQPLILGFVVAGIAMGPYTGGLTVTDLIDVQLLSQVGVALLLFALGVEFSLAAIRPVAPMAIFGTITQIVLTFLFGYAVGQLLGWEVMPSFWFAALIVLSSPIVALQALQGLKPGEILVARLSRSILIVQNLIVVAMVFVMRQFQTGHTDLPTLALAALEGVAFLALLLFVGTYILPRLYAVIARQTNGELSLLIVIACAAVIVYGIYLYGLTFVEVAFAIGLLLSESELGSRALRAMMSMRDLFGVLFFVSAGMILDLTFLGANIGLVLALAALVALAKMVIFAAVTWFFGYRNGEALVVAFTLFQLGELSFVLARLVLDAGAITDDLYSLIIAIGLITMLLTPLFARLSRRWRPQITEPSAPLSQP